jgi:hypothetical protein
LNDDVDAVDVAVALAVRDDDADDDDKDDDDDDDDDDAAAAEVAAAAATAAAEDADLESLGGVRPRVRRCRWCRDAARTAASRAAFFSATARGDANKVDRQRSRIAYPLCGVLSMYEL